MVLKAEYKAGWQEPDVRKSGCLVPSVGQSCSRVFRKVTSGHCSDSRFRSHSLERR